MYKQEVRNGRVSHGQLDVGLEDLVCLWAQGGCQLETMSLAIIAERKGMRARQMVQVIELIDLTISSFGLAA